MSHFSSCVWKHSQLVSYEKQKPKVYKFQSRRKGILREVGLSSKKGKKPLFQGLDSLYLPKELEGLSLRNTREVNLALISKLGWKLLNRSDSMWVTQLHYKYLNSSSLLSPPPSPLILFFSLMAMERHFEIHFFHLQRCLQQNS